MTLHELKTWKPGDAPIVMLTAYDHTMASILASAGLDVILVGDSLGNVVQGKGSTREVTMDQMCYHTEMVVRGAGDVLVIADLPRDSYRTPKEAVANARRLVDCGAGVVKYEGSFPEILKALRENNIEVMGHVGLLPQTAEKYTVQGKDEESASRLKRETREIAEGGACSFVIECVPEELAAELTSSVSIPSIGIGAGNRCSGQVLVLNDLLGLRNTFQPKFVKQYADLDHIIKSAVMGYAQDVRKGIFPGFEHSYH